MKFDQELVVERGKGRPNVEGPQDHRHGSQAEFASVGVRGRQRSWPSKEQSRGGR